MADDLKATVSGLLNPLPMAARDEGSDLHQTVSGLLAEPQFHEEGLIDAASRVLGLFGQGAKDGWHEATTFAPETEKYLRENGLHADLTGNQQQIGQAFNGAIMRPAANNIVVEALRRGGVETLGQIMRGGAYVFGVPAALIGGLDAAIMGETGRQGPVGAAMDAFPLMGGELGGFGPPRQRMPATRRAALETPSYDAMRAAQADLRTQEMAARDVGQDLYEAYALRAIGKGGEGAYFGLEPYAPLDPEFAHIQPEARPTNIHEAVRQAQPDLFAEYDAMSERKDALRAQIAQAQEQLRSQAEAQNPKAAQIAEWQDRLDRMTPTMREKYGDALETRIKDARAEFADQFAMLTRDTPEIGDMRQELLAADYRMRDLAPDVQEAYRDAAKDWQAPEEPVEAPREPEAPSEAPTPEAPAEAAPTPTAEPTAPARPPVNIADDVATKLQAAGRPLEEAQASGAIVDAYWRTRAAHFGEDAGALYGRMGSDIKAGGKGGRGGLAQGKIRLPASMENGRAVVTLFEKADASTFLHETGHEWLERMMADGRNPNAPAPIAAEAANVRKWLGMKEDQAAPTTAQHERFARAWEQYLREGIAPTQALAGVFQQFRDWLRSIYQTLQGLGKPIDAEIRGIFDRMLAVAPDARETVIAPERAFASAVEEVKASPLFAKVPKEPTRLTEFLRRPTVQFAGTIHETRTPGGLLDPGGDVAAIIGGPKGRPGLINNTSGLHLDHAALRAWEEGYFHDQGQRPTINDLLDKISEDVNGNPQYSMHDLEAVQAYKDAIAHNEEVQRLSDQHGISTRGKTREQFFDEVRAKMGEEEAAKAAEQSAEDHTYALTDAEEAWRDSIPPDETAGMEPDYRPPPSWEEMDGAYRQEESAARPVEGDADTGRSDRAAGSEAVRQGGEGQGGGGAGAGRRDTASEGYYGTSAPDELVRKGGNIRLDNLNAPEDVKLAVEALAREDNDFWDARGGVISDIERRQMADQLGLSVDTFDFRKPEGVSNSVWTEAVQKLFVQANAQFAEISGKFARSGSVEDLADYTATKQRVLMIARYFSNMTAEAGRTLRVFDKANIDFAKDLTTQLRAENQGRTLFQMQEEARLAASMDDPRKAMKFITEVDDGRWGRTRKAIISYYVNSLISGPITHAAYLVGNEVQSLVKMGLVTPGQAALGSLREMLGGKAGDRVYWGEVGAQLYGHFYGWGAGIVPAVKALQSGVPFMKGIEGLEAAKFREAAEGAPQRVLNVSALTTEGGGRPAALGKQQIAIYDATMERLAREKAAADGLTGEEADAAAQRFIREPPKEAVDAATRASAQTIPGVAGRILETPARIVNAIHTLGYSANYEQEIARLAFRDAAARGLDGNDLAASIAKFRADPPVDAMEAAHNEAMRMMLMKSAKPGGAQYHVGQAVSNFLPAKLAMPFMQVGMNILETSADMTLLALAKEDARADLMGRNGGAAFDLRAGKIMVGAGISTAIIGMAMNGLITDGGPRDPNQRRMMEESGWKPYSFKWGDQYIPFRKWLGGLGPLVAAASNVPRIAGLAEEGDLAKVAAALSFGFGEVVADESWMKSLADFVEAVHNWEHKGDRYVRNMAASFVPFSSAMNQTARMVDPYQRDAHTLIDSILNKIPMASETLLPQLDAWGEPIASHLILSPSTDKHDPVDERMVALGMGRPRPFDKKINGVELTPEQYFEYMQTGGRFRKMMLDNLVAQRGFANAPDHIQKELIEQTLAAAKKMATGAMLANHYDVTLKSADTKAKLLMGIKP